MARKDWIPYRQEKLTSEGFLPFEAKYYSQFPLSQTGMRQIRYTRRREIFKATKAGIPSKQIPNYILSSYKAKDLLDEYGKPDAEMYNSALFRQLEKPLKQRESIFMQPDRFNIFKEAKEARFTIKDSLNLALLIPKEEWDKRKEQYRQLIAARYAPYEALYIITATFKDKEGNKILQKLDLEQPAWQTAMQERQNYFIQEVRKGIQKGMSTRNAIRKFKREINDWYAKDKKRTPFDEIEDVSPTGPHKPLVDIQEARKNRRAKQRATGAPFLTHA